MKKLKNKFLIVMIFLGMCCAQFLVFAQHQQGRLTGIRFVVDCGHGGFDKGASAQGVDEAPLNLEIGLRLKKLLESHGAKVQLTRKDENDLASNSATNRKREDIRKRIELINQETNDFFISIHMNKFSTESPKGAQVFYWDTHPMNERMALSLQQALNLCTKENKIIKKGDFLLLNEAKTPGVLVECGFLSNDVDRTRLQQGTYQSELVKAMVEGIIKIVQDLQFE